MEFHRVFILALLFQSLNIELTCFYWIHSIGKVVVYDNNRTRSTPSLTKTLFDSAYVSEIVFGFLGKESFKYIGGESTPTAFSGTDFYKHD